ncbi:MAG: hypothetical protein JO030_04110 [Candidatus Eremiobacteraeota bacterium]|nr:hypothetical protein [Candidatus Eremiobacteraeota bacterium]
MNRNAFVAVLFLCALPAAAGAGGLDELNRFAGTWDAPGTLLTTPYSTAGRADAVNICGWSTDHVFMICQQRISTGGKLSHVVSIYTYDETTNQYHFFNVHRNGAASTTITVGADTITYTDTFTDNGKNVTIRTLNVWENRDRYRWRTEYSTDGGATWSLMASGISQRRGVEAPH